MNDKDLAIKILELVGGKENVISVAHCVTRLRFKLKDESKANDEAIESIAKVQGLVKKGGQYQVVLGPGIVDRIHDETLLLTELEGISLDDNEDGKKLSPFDYFVDLVAGVFTPVLGLLAAGGMVKGIAVLFVSFGIVENGGNTYEILNGIGDSFFAFMPIILGFYAMKKFKGTPMLGALLGAVLVYPAITALASADSINVLFEGTIFASEVKSTFFGIPLILPAGGYGSTVIPILGITFFASKMERGLKRKLPDYLQLFLVPMTVLLVMSILGLLIIGPILSILQTMIGTFFLTIQGFSPILYGFILAGLWQVLVIFGLHWAVIPLAFLDLAALQNGEIDKMFSFSPTAIVSFVAIGAVLAIYTRTKNSELKQIALPSFITGIFGITEPALYGVLLPRKKVFITTCLISAVFGGLIGLFKVGGYQVAGLGIFALPGNLNPNVTSFMEQTDFIIMAILMLLATVVSFIVVYLFVYKEDNKITHSVKSPVEGLLIETFDIDDEVFKSETMGSTMGIKPTSNVVTSPVSGTVDSIFPTKHAIGIKSKDGLELLIHVGINTVELKGECFESLVKVGDVINAGDEILNVKFDEILEKGYDDTVITVVLNSQNFTSVNKSEKIRFTKKDNIFEIEK